MHVVFSVSMKEHWSHVCIEVFLNENGAKKVEGIKKVKFSLGSEEV